MKIDIDLLLKTGQVPYMVGDLAHRHVSIKMLVELCKTIQPKVMIETGCQSNNLLHAHGMSTSIFASLAEKYQGHLHTVDINEKHINLCKKLTQDQKKFITFHNQDSLEFLKNYNGPPIDLLYLDSYDFYEGIEEESREHQLREIEYAFSKLAKPAIVLLDDANVSMWFSKALNPTDIEGKTYYAHRYLLIMKAKCLVDSYQRLYLVE